MKKLIVIGIAMLASMMTVAVVLAGHPWNGYPGPADNPSPIVADINAADNGFGASGPP